MKSPVKTLDVGQLSTGFPDLSVPGVFLEDRPVGFPKAAEAYGLPEAPENSVPEANVRPGAAVSDHERHDLSSSPAESYPQPSLIRALLHSLSAAAQVQFSCSIPDRHIVFPFPQNRYAPTSGSERRPASAHRSAPTDFVDSAWRDTGSPPTRLLPALSLRPSRASDDSLAGTPGPTASSP